MTGGDLFVPSKLRERIEQWRKEGYICDYPVISEILQYNLVGAGDEGQTLRYLRRAQFEALETYWYLRLVEKTPHIFELYTRLYDDPVKLLQALGISLPKEDLIRILGSGGGLNTLFDKVKQDDAFAKANKLEAVRESLVLQYPSYILALAMGAGKTVLIGSIVATEFAMALEYGGDFVKNALVFAPGKTILGALKELSDVPYEKILPPRHNKHFMASVKITYTQDNEKDIPIVRGSSYNIVVTNTEKIRIQKPTGKTVQFNILNYKEVEKFEEENEVANLRLQSVASLPNLAIFSDEAHHTYGQSLEKELKKVRKTVDYLADNTNVIVVVNTTGTPYYKKQMLRDVVYWYGLSQGIRDGILKEIKESIFSYDMGSIDDFVSTVLDDFFTEYKNVQTYDGAKSKLAIYFPQTDDVEQIKHLVQERVTALGLDPSTVLEVNNQSDENVKDFFNNRINETHNPYRVYLLVNMGTEGWNCPSLFATALARKLKSSNNFVLQAASRCLRQVSGNTKRARIYLAKENVNVLDAQLKETYGESLQILSMTKQEMRTGKVILRKTEILPLVLKRKNKRIVYDESIGGEIQLEKPACTTIRGKKIVYDAKESQDNKHVLTAIGEEDIDVSENVSDTYEVAGDLAATYRLDPARIFELLSTIYQDGDVPRDHFVMLCQQIEAQRKNYRMIEEEVEIALAIVRKDGFDREEIDGKTFFTTEIIYHKDKEDLLLRFEQLQDINKRDFSFHYSPYRMDSHPEKELFLQLLESLNENPDDVEDIYYMGAITDPGKTDFWFEYLDKSGKYRNYTPDFLIRKKNGKVLIVEVKAERFREEVKEMALREIENLNKDDVKYEILFTDKDNIPFSERQKVRQWIYEAKR